MKKHLQKDLKKPRNRKKTALFFSALLFVFVGGYVWENYRPVHLLQQGISFEQGKQFDQALLTYKQLLKTKLPRTEKATALYRIARIYQYEQKNYQTALFFYLRLEKEYPQTQYINQARMEAADLLKFQQQDCQQAIPFYQRLIEHKSSLADRSQYEIADCYVRLQNWAQAAIEFETLINTYEQTDLLPLASYRYANNLVLSGQGDAARLAFEQVITQYAEHKLAREAGFRLAEMREEEGDNFSALDAYVALNTAEKSSRIQLKIDQIKRRIAEKKRVK